MKRRLPALVLATLIPAILASFGQARSASPCPPGFAALQNSDACVRISGRVGADALVGTPRTRSSDTYEARVRGRVQLEVRKPTEFGPFRGVIHAEGVGR